MAPDETTFATMVGSYFTLLYSAEGATASGISDIHASAQLRADCRSLDGCMLILTQKQKEKNKNNLAGYLHLSPLPFDLDAVSRRCDRLVDHLGFHGRAAVRNKCILATRHEMEETIGTKLEPQFEQEWFALDATVSAAVADMTATVDADQLHRAINLRVQVFMLGLKNLATYVGSHDPKTYTLEFPGDDTTLATAYKL